jgi:hypothetical protein
MQATGREYAALTAGRTRQPANLFDVGLAPFAPRTSV